MDDTSNVLPGLAGGVGFGGAVGLAVGYTAKKVGKLVLLGIGAVFVVVQGLAYLELIDIDWKAVQQVAENTWETSDGTLADRAWEMVSNNLPFGGGFAAGFALGFKMG